MSKEVIVLMDNGSLRAEATFQLRSLAEKLSVRVGEKVYPVSLLHSSKVDADLLDGEKAQTFVPFLRKMKELGKHRFTVVPLFFGESGALVDYLPKRVADLQAEGWNELQVHVCDPLVQQEDTRVAQIMAAIVSPQLAEKGWESAAVAMCDHGTPSKVVNAVRELVAEQLQELLPSNVVRACSMERREGAEYDFNEPLLENLLGTEGFSEKVIISPLFISPGRHAGENGDVAQICQQAEKEVATLETQMTPLVGAGAEMLVEILADRLRSLEREDR